ncbi:MAG: hypothetical protein HC840_00650 [Leptolyngbyaceae cyanobacterium RM2_2_4]|nr:hypothetical protein [Leptolyngbyaceae cyanobacterium RM2_2_4]
MTTKKKETLDLSKLERFTKLDDQEFIMKKIGSKRDSMVGVGQYEVGDFSLMEYPATENQPEAVGAFITGRGFNYLRTSPIVKIVAYDANSTTFETEGGIYKLEKYVPGKQALE